MEGRPRGELKKFVGTVRPEGVQVLAVQLLTIEWWPERTSRTNNTERDTRQAADE